MADLTGSCMSETLLSDFCTLLYAIAHYFHSVCTADPLVFLLFLNFKAKFQKGPLNETF